MKVSIISALLILLTACLEDLSIESNLPPPTDASITSSASAPEDFSTLNSQVSSILFESGAWKDVFKNAKKERKPIFIYGYAAWCSPCRYVNSTLLVDSTVVTYFNSNFMSMRFEMENIYSQQTSDAWDILREYNIQLEAYPIYLFLNSKGEVVSQLIGVPDASTLISEAQKALDETKVK